MAIVKHNQRSLRNKFCRKCRAQIFYWGHDTDDTAMRSSHSRYCGEHDSYSWIPLNSDGSAHTHFGEAIPDNMSGNDSDFDVRDDQPNHAPEAAINAAMVAGERDVNLAIAQDAASDALSAALGPLANLLRPFLAATVDESQVRSIVTDMLAGVSHPLRVEVSSNGVIRQVEGTAHTMLPTVIKRLARKRHVLMVGPAGTGKSHLAHQASEALGLEFGSISLTPQTPTSAITGYMTATGSYVTTQFRERFEHGGVFLFDEFDNGHPSTLGIVNAALANGHMAFPDGMVKRHEDFRCVASANTYGRGNDRAYVGRQALDAATLDRFTVLTVEVDEALEESMVLATGLDLGRVSAVLAYVRHLRAKADEHKLPLVFSPRRSESLADAIADGFKVREAIDMEIRRGISDADWRKVTDGAPSLY